MLQMLVHLQQCETTYGSYFKYLNTKNMLSSIYEIALSLRVLRNKIKCGYSEGKCYVQHLIGRGSGLNHVETCLASESV